jgi:dTDP-glucose 4,6-dehydratase
VADALAHIINIPLFDARVKYQNMCQKFNIVGKEEVDNLTLATMIAEALGREHFKYELVDFHSARPGHDLRYALSGERLMALGWWPKKSVRDRINEVVDWSVNNPAWM